MPVNYFYGLNMRWALNGVSCISFGVSSLIQSADVESSMAGQATYANQLGNTNIVALFDPTKDLSIDYVPANSATADGNLVTSALQPVRGTKVTLVDSIDSSNAINGSNWIVLKVGEPRVVNGAVTVKLTLKSWDGVA